MGDGDGDETMTENPLAPKSPDNKEKEPEDNSDPMEVDEKVDAVDTKIDLEQKEAPSTIELVPSKPTKPADDIPPVVKAVCQRLPDFKILLQTAPSRDLELPFCRLSPPLGPVHHKVVDMIVALMRTPSTMVSEKLRELGLIRICIELFFEYPWNNLLHGSVEHIIQMVVSGDCAILKRALFEDCDFLNRILEARECSAKHQETNHFRLGYMGHITRVSNTIVEFAKRNVQLEGYMESNEDWMKFIGDDLKLENEQLSTQLGGHRPTQLGDDDGDEFPLFALDNIGSNATDDLLGDNFDENEEVDHDSDSDHSSEEDAVNLDECDKKESEYELPQDAFERLTQKMDDIAQKNDESMIGLDMKR